MSRALRDKLRLVSIIHTDSAAATLMNQSFQPADKRGLRSSSISLSLSLRYRTAPQKCPPRDRPLAECCLIPSLHLQFANPRHANEGEADEESESWFNPESALQDTERVFGEREKKKNKN